MKFVNESLLFFLLTKVFMATGESLSGIWLRADFANTKGREPVDCLLSSDTDSLNSFPYK